MDCNIWSCRRWPALCGAPMHGSGRHRKPDLILLAEGLICPKERERERGSASGLEEYYDETGESDVATRGGIVYEAQNCRRCTAFMHCPVVQFSTLKSRPRPTPLQPSESASLSPSLDPPFSSHVRIKPHNNGENNRLPAAVLPPPILRLPLALPSVL